VLNAIDLHACDGVAFQRRQQDAAQCIAYGDTKTWLKGSEFKGAIELGRVQHDYLVWFLEI
jgi:hypothetical protein